MIEKPERAPPSDDLLSEAIERGGEFALPPDGAENHPSGHLRMVENPATLRDHVTNLALVLESEAWLHKTKIIERLRIRDYAGAAELAEKAENKHLIAERLRHVLNLSKEEAT